MEGLLRALQKSRPQLLRLPNVVGVGVGIKQVAGEATGKKALVVFVKKKVPPGELARAHRVPREIEGVPTDVVEIGEVRLLGLRTERVRPARPGVSIGHYKVTAGTFGAVVRDRTTGKRLILSNNHILANATDGRDGRAFVGDPVLQPGPYDGGGAGDRIGTLLRFAPLVRAVQEADCPVAAAVVRAGNRLIRGVRPHYELKMFKRYQGANVIDAALALPDAPDLVEEEILEVGRVEGLAQASPGLKVLKSGRTSGLTAGTVTAVSVTLEVDVGDNAKGWFTDQVVTDMNSQPGDSGSLVLDERQRAVGLLFAGSEKYTIFNRIDQVLSRLEVEL
ncbi:hypothetical protein [Desulfovirgula thermocuniculi]|uniref:hypothetical protein n=1 Tax=Desulfovirgula thermocuniculi TaxID=348842 RepID=UPI0004122C4B|nr:hypothetical protein [Desulfovirgula thermocuniculi]